MVAPDKKIFLKNVFAITMTSCIAKCLHISPSPPPSSFSFIHQWEVTEGGSAIARVNKSRGWKMKSGPELAFADGLYPGGPACGERCICCCSSPFSASFRVSGVWACTQGGHVMGQEEVAGRGRGCPAGVGLRSGPHCW